MSAYHGGVEITVADQFREYSFQVFLFAQKLFK